MALPSFNIPSLITKSLCHIECDDILMINITDYTYPQTIYMGDIQTIYMGDISIVSQVQKLFLY